MKPLLAITLGDPAGIGPEIVLSSLEWAKTHCRPVLFGHWPTFKAAMEQAQSVISICCSDHIDENSQEIQFIPTKGPAVPIWNPDHLDAATAQFDALQMAVDQILAGPCQGLVTAPVSKASINRVHLGFSGHTEYLAMRAGLDPDDVTMVFGSPQLVVGLLTTHIPLSAVPSTLTPWRYGRTTNHVVEIARRAMNTKRPRIVLPGLNPHAGESGLLGTEELDIIAPFCASQQQRPDAELVGPVAPEAAYRDALNGRYQGVVAAYHDQALIPLKLHGFGEMVNITAGLPFVRTSPDHGTATDIARQGMADSRAMKTAIDMAITLMKAAP